jgi:hypothetical protein
LSLRVRARWSGPFSLLRGTTGFGFWNDPIDAAGRFRGAPSHLWFFHASPPSRVRGRAGEGRGFVGAAMRGGALPPGALAVGSLALRLPGMRRLATAVGGRVVSDQDMPLPADLDPLLWHDFELDWRDGEARFAVDGVEVARLSGSAVPTGPLGFVAWIDNNWAALEDDGAFRAGRLAVPGEQWLELASVEVAPGGTSGPTT